MGEHTHLDAERCAALEKLLYVAQALAVIFRLRINLERREGWWEFGLRTPRLGFQTACICPKRVSFSSERILLAVFALGPILREPRHKSRSREVEEAVVLGRGKWRWLATIPIDVTAYSCTGAINSPCYTMGKWRNINKTVHCTLTDNKVIKHIQQ